MHLFIILAGLKQIAHINYDCYCSYLNDMFIIQSHLKLLNGIVYFFDCLILIIFQQFFLV